MRKHATRVNRQYHIDCIKGDLAEILIVPGDPDRVPKIAKQWDSRREISSRREFRSFTGEFKGVPVSALSSGIGPACISIVVNEASSIGVKTFIRVGSTGAIQEDIRCGDVVISSAAVRLDGTSNCYIVPEYPASTDYEVLMALVEAAEVLGVDSYHVGITATTADFYAGQDRTTPASCLSFQDDMCGILQKARVLNLEMETATLFTLASLYGLRAGSVCAVFGNRITGELKPGAGEEDAIRIANEAAKILFEWDSVKKRRRKRLFFPSLIRGA